MTEEISDRLVRLPFYNDLCQAHQDRVIDAIIEFYEPRRTLSYSITPLKPVTKTQARSSSISIPQTSELTMKAGPEGKVGVLLGSKK